MNKNCLIVGLPYVGKSTYIGALWHVVQYSGDKIDLSLVASDENLPDNTIQLAALSKSWHNVEDMDRTSSDAPNSISFILKKKDQKDEFTLNVPDFRGESIRQIVNGTQPAEFDEWCAKADSILFMMSEYNTGVFADDFYDDDDEQTKDNETTTEEKNPPFDVKSMTPAALNMLLLRFLREHTKTERIVVCLTAWDEIMESKPDAVPEDYLKSKALSLFNFINYHYPKAKFVGLSAQGGKYDYQKQENSQSSIVTPECKKKFQELTLKGERAYVVIEGKKSFDITAPISLLI